MILNNLGEQNNLVVMVGHILDYHPALIKLKEYISSGELGQIYYLRQPHQSWPGARRRKRDVGFGSA